VLYDLSRIHLPMARYQPDHVAIVQGDVRVTYGELERRVEAVARHLLGGGLAPGSHVGLLTGNDYRYVEGLLGIMRAGMVPVPLSDRFPDERTRFILEHSDSAALLVAPTCGATGLRMAAALPAIRLYALGPAEGVAELRGAPVFDGELPAIQPDDLSMLAYTSGSTGTPKGVLLTHRGQVWNFRTVAKVLMLDEDDCAIVAAPLYHKNAGMTLKATLMTGGRLVILDRFEARNYLDAIRAHDGTFISGVPAMFSMILRETFDDGHTYDTVRLIQCGSAVVSDQLIRSLQQKFPRAFVGDGYGLTEGGPDVLFSPPWGIRKLGSTGIPLPGIEVKIVRPDGSETDVDEVGELLTRNPGVMVGYYKDPEKTRERLEPDGFLHTGDLARRDSEGFVYLAGRADDMIKVGGEKVYPKEVEEVLLTHPTIHECVVVPIPHELKGEAPVAFVVLKAEATEAEIKAYALEHLPAFAHPRRVFVRDALPTNAAGKVDRMRLKQEALSAVEGG
jgi:long-chain acyl-CoA synthetase